MLSGSAVMLQAVTSSIGGGGSGGQITTRLALPVEFLVVTGETIANTWLDRLEKALHRLTKFPRCAARYIGKSNYARAAPFSSCLCSLRCEPIIPKFEHQQIVVPKPSLDRG